MTFFDDVLRGANGRMNFDPYEGSGDPPRSWTATFKAAPRKTVSMELGRVWQTGWNDEGTEVDAKTPDEKTHTKLKINHGDCTTTWGFTNEKFSGSGSGILYDADGYKSNLTGGLENKPAKGEWKATGEATLQTPDLGGAKLGVNAGFEYKLDGSSTMVKPKVNINLQEEIHVGVSAEHDTKDLKKGIFHTVYAPKTGGSYWLRGNMISNVFSAGCDNTIADNTHHSFEGAYMTEKGAEGAMGQPVVLRGGVSYTLSDATELEASAEWGKHVSVEQTVTHECDKHWTVSATQNFDSEFINTKRGAYNIGFGVTYKL